MAEEGAPSYARGARILAVGIGVTGLVTFAFFSLASYAVGPEEYGGIATLWTVLFISMTVAYRPVEQLLSRSVAQARTAGEAPALRTAALLQIGFAALFVAIAFAARGPLEDALGNDDLFWVLIGAALAYAVSYFARGVVAGQQRFGLYGGLVLFEALVRVLFPLAVVAGLATGQTFVALGILAAPVASLAVVPWLLRSQGQGSDPWSAGRSGPVAGADRTGGLTPVPRAAAGFAGAVALIQVGEQVLLNAAVLFVPAGVTAGVVFNAFLVTRVPLQLFQSVQTSLLPHLASVSPAEAAAAIRKTIVVMAGLAGAVALGLLLIGPWAMDIPFEDDVRYDRWGLAAIAVGMGFHLIAGTLNQGALARGQAGTAAGMWLAAAALFVIWLAAAPFDDDLARAQTGYLAATGVLALLLFGAQKHHQRTRSHS